MNGFELLGSSLSKELVSDLSSAIDNIISSGESSGADFYYEKTINGKVLCRIERFIALDKVFFNLIENIIPSILDDCFGKKFFLFKDKLNFKYSGGNGFAFHQDHPAYSDFPPDYFITVGIPLDDFTTTNGCLLFSREVNEKKILDIDDKGIILEDFLTERSWTPLFPKIGDIIVFDSYVPHFSLQNNSPCSRRCIFLTYNDSIFGNFYDEYFTKKKVGLKNNDIKYNLGNPILV